MARKWSNLNLPGALHYVTGNSDVEIGHQVWQESFKAFPLWSQRLIWQKINYIHANLVKARLVRSANDYYWSGFGSFYGMRDDPLAVDRDWWWPDDDEKLKRAIIEMGWKDLPG